MAAMTPRQELIGHVSPETAYLVSDYPYGFRLRTEIRYWVETRASYGQRVMSQTRDPKRAARPWNKPKGSTYAEVKALYLDDWKHVQHASLSLHSTEAELVAFQAMFPLTCTEPRNAECLLLLMARQRASARLRGGGTAVPPYTAVREPS
jgi:hypothetical protein